LSNRESGATLRPGIVPIPKISQYSKP